MRFFFFLPVPSNKDLLKKKSMCVGWHVQRAGVKARGRLRISCFSRSEGAACYPRSKCVLAINESLIQAQGACSAFLASAKLQVVIFSQTVFFPVA